MKRVVFSFDDRSLADLTAIKQGGRFVSLGETVRSSIGTASALFTQAEHGFTELIVRDPQSGRERQIIIPTLACGLRKGVMA